MRHIVFMVFIAWQISSCASRKGSSPFSCAPQQEQVYPLVHGSPGKTDTIIVSHNTLDAPYIKYTVPNHELYAKEHGYDYWFRNGTIDHREFENPKGEGCIFKLGLYWQKIAAIEDALNMRDGDKPKYEWVFWIDADAVFTNRKKSLSDLRRDTHFESQNFMIAKDLASCVNAGVMLLHNTPATRELFHEVRESFNNYKNYSLPEQTAIEDLILGYAHYDHGQLTIASYASPKCGHPLAGIVVVEQQVMNSFYVKHHPKKVVWQPGDFIAHFAGDGRRNDNIPYFLRCLSQHLDGKGCEDR